MEPKIIISETLATGITQQALAALVPCSQSTINALLNGSRGKRLSFAIASRLVAIHADMCIKPARRKASALQS